MFGFRFVGLTAPACSPGSEGSFMGSFALLLLAAGLTGFGSTGGQVISVSYVDENSSKIQSPVYLGENLFQFFVPHE